MCGVAWCGDQDPALPGPRETILCSSIRVVGVVRGCSRMDRVEGQLLCLFACDTPLALRNSDESSPGVSATKGNAKTDCAVRSDARMVRYMMVGYMII